MSRGRNLILLPASVAGVSLISASVLVAPDPDPAVAAPRDVEKVATATGTGGAAASLDPRASQAAIDILDRGGNAIDAAVAASAMLGVVRPYDGGIGGDGYMAIYLADEDEVITIDHEAMAPGELDQPAFRDLPTRRARAQSVAVPGLVRGWETALEEYGTMPLHRVLQPATTEALRGFVVDEQYVARTASNRNKMLDYTSSSEYYLTDDLEVPELGSIVRNRDLARTYKTIGREGADAFYTGEIAEAIVDTVSSPPVADGVPVEIAPGALTRDDLADYTAIRREPVTSTYRDYEIIGVEGASTGGPTVAEILNIMEGFEFDSREEALHAYIEASRLSFADRATYIGTAPDWLGAVPLSDAPYAGIMSEEFAAERRGLIDEEAIPGSVPPGDPFAYDTAPAEGEPADLSDFPGEQPDPTSTTHLTVSDKDGNVVSFTFTITSIAGSGIAVPGHGFLLNNDNIGSIPPPEPGDRGGRMYSNIAPTFVMKDGEVQLTVGSPGGARIISTAALIVANHVDFGMDLEEALVEPRVANTSASLPTSAEGTLLDEQPDLADALEDRGHDLRRTGTVGNANGIQFFPDGTVTAVAEPERLDGGGAAVQTPIE